GVRLRERQSGRRDSGGGEVHAGDAGGFEDRLLLGLQQLDLLVDELSERVRDPRLQILRAPQEAPPPIHLAQLILADEVVDRVHQKQRVTVRVSVEYRREVRGQLVSGKPAREVLADGRLAEARQRELVPVRVQLELVFHPLQGMRGGRDVGGSIRGHHQEARRFPPTRQHAQQIDGGRVTPVQIFEEQHERRVERQRVERLYQLAQHSIARRTLRAVPDRLHLAVLQQARQLLQPRRGMLLEDVNQSVVPRRPP